MTWFTTKLAAQKWRAIADGDNQAMIGYREGREFVGPLATVYLNMTEEDEDGTEVYSPESSDVRRMYAIVALPMIAELFGRILNDEMSLEQVRSEVEDICDVIEDTMEHEVGAFELGMEGPMR